jgi:hypothetical protein
MRTASATVARTLTAAPVSTVDTDALAALRTGLVDGVRGSVGDLPPGGLIEIDLPVLRRARFRPETLGAPQAPFTWKPAFARRSLGLAAVRACADGRFRAPADAVGPLAEAAVDEWRRTGWRTFHWEPWLAGLGPGARAAVLAEAVTWASPVWAAFDWSTLGPRADIGGAGDRWTCPAPRTVRLTGRHEVRVRIDAAGEDGSGLLDREPTALVSVSCGIPGEGWREELAYLSLVAGLRSPHRPVPARVLGLWPEAGERRTVEIDSEVLAVAAERVVASVQVLAAGRTPSTTGEPTVRPRSEAVPA